MTAAAIVSLMIGCIAAGLLWIADAWAMGFDIGKGKRLPWWTLYALGAVLLVVGGLGFVLTTSS